MNSFSSMIINSKSSNKQVTLSMSAHSHSFNPTIRAHRFNESLVKFFTSHHHHPMINQDLHPNNNRKHLYRRKKDDHEHHRHSSNVAVPVNTYFRPIILVDRHMKRHYHRQRSICEHDLPSSLHRMMIGVDHNHPVELMQQQPPPPFLPSHSVNHLQSSSLSTTDPSSTIYDNNHNLHLTQTTTSRSILSRIRLGLRCLCSLNDKQQQQQAFEHIFSSNEQTTNISERILDEYVPRLTNNAHSSLIVLCGQAREVAKLHSILVSSTLTRLFHFVNDQQSSKKNFLLRLTAQELSSEISPKTGLEHNVSCPLQSAQYLDCLCSEYRHLPFVITFHLVLRSSNTIIGQLHILSTNDTNDDVDSQTSIANFLLSMVQKQTSFHLSNKRHSLESQTKTCLTSILYEFITNEHKRFLYVLSTIKNETQLKSWTKLQRLFKGKSTARLKMSREKSDLMGDSSSVETVVNRHGDEIWVDGPYCSTKLRSPKNEIWIDGPREFCSFSPSMRQKSTPKHRSTHHHQTKSMHTKPKPSSIESPCTILSPKHTLSPFISTKFAHGGHSRGNTDESSSSAACDTESVVSSHCHLPVLPVFKDHSLLPFRLPSNTTTSPPPELISQTLPRKPTTSLTPKHNPPSSLTLSTNELNDGMEMLEKTLETLLVPSPLVPSTTNNETIMTKSLNRIDELSALMSNDEKSKRLSRIVSPTRFDKLLVHNDSPSTSTNVTPAHVPRCNPTPPLAGSSVPNSPVIVTRNRHSRALTSTPHTSQLAPRSPFIDHRSSSSNKHQTVLSKKPKAPVRTTSLAENARPTTRLSILQRLFGLRSSSAIPPSTPVVVIPPSPTPVRSPLISPLTVTLDSHDDLMPLTTSSTASSASGRASSSGYESMSNTVLEEMIASTSTTLTGANSSIKVRSKSARKDERRSDSNNTIWNSPLIRDKSRQQRLSQLKHHQNELKLELAMTKTFLLMDRNKHFDHGDSVNPTMAQSPMNTTIPHVNDYDEEDELERDIEHLERRLAAAKCHLLSNQRNPRMNIETSK